MIFYIPHPEKKSSSKKTQIVLKKGLKLCREIIWLRRKKSIRKAADKLPCQTLCHFLQRDEVCRRFFSSLFLMEEIKCDRVFFFFFSPLLEILKALKQKSSPSLCIEAAARRCCSLEENCFTNSTSCGKTGSAQRQLVRDSAELRYAGGSKV